MAVVSITWSESAGGSAMDDPKDWGNIGNGSAATALEIFISHDGGSPITACGLYIQPYSGTGYSGSAGATADYNEIIAWGDTATSSDEIYVAGTVDGGFFINRNSSAPASGWVVHCAGTGVSGGEFGLFTTMNIATADTIILAEEATCSVAIVVPQYEATAGTRFFDQCLKYTYTS